MPSFAGCRTQMWPRDRGRGSEQRRDFPQSETSLTLPRKRHVFDARLNDAQCFLRLFGSSKLCDNCAPDEASTWDLGSLIGTLCNSTSMPKTSGLEKALKLLIPRTNPMVKQGRVVTTTTGTCRTLCLVSAFDPILSSLTSSPNVTSPTIPNHSLRYLLSSVESVGISRLQKTFDMGCDRRYRYRYSKDATRAELVSQSDCGGRRVSPPTRSRITRNRSLDGQVRSRPYRTKRKRDYRGAAL